jgi:hypothetical protein
MILFAFLVHKHLLILFASVATHGHFASITTREFTHVFSGLQQLPRTLALSVMAFLL